MIKTIIFDMGDVLIKNKWEKISEKIEKKYGVSTLIHSRGSEEAIREYKKAHAGKSSLDKVFELMGADKRLIPEIIRDYKEEYRKSKIVNKRLLKLVKELKKDYPVVCLTDTIQSHYEVNKKIGIFKEFERVFASHLQGTTKESSASFKKILKELKNKPEQVLFIDDSEDNIKNAKLLGINCILYKDFPKIKKLKKEILNKLKCQPKFLKG